MQLKKLLSYLKANALVVATAESCTAGLIAGRLADASGVGSSLEVGYVVYSPKAKCRRPAGSYVAAGTVCFAWALRTGDDPRVFSETRHFDGSRNVVRRSAADYALERIPHYHRCIQESVAS